MLIPIVHPKEEVIYDECQHLIDLYTDGIVVGVYSTYYAEDQWVFRFMKTVYDSKVEVIDDLIIKTKGTVDWNEINQKIDDFFDDVKCIISYDEPNALSYDEDKKEVLDINIMTMHCCNYFRYRGLDVVGIEYARAMFDYGEGIENLRLDIVLLELIDEIINKFNIIIKEDEVNIKPE
jgi:hypothetical protein